MGGGINLFFCLGYFVFLDISGFLAFLDVFFFLLSSVKCNQGGIMVVGCLPSS